MVFFEVHFWRADFFSSLLEVFRQAQDDNFFKAAFAAKVPQLEDRNPLPDKIPPCPPCEIRPFFLA